MVVGDSVVIFDLYFANGRENGAMTRRERREKEATAFITSARAAKVFGLTHRLRSNSGMAGGELNFFTLTHI